MATISIDMNSEKKEIYLLGDLDSLKKHRFAWSYIQSALKPHVEKDQIILSVGDTDPVAMLSQLRKLLKKYGFQEAQTKSSEKILNDFYKEEKKFAEFSDKALKIKNNECDAEEFASFTTAIEKNLPQRSLYPL